MQTTNTSTTNVVPFERFLGRYDVNMPAIDRELELLAGTSARATSAVVVIDTADATSLPMVSALDVDLTGGIIVVTRPREAVAVALEGCSAIEPSSVALVCAQLRDAACAPFGFVVMPIDGHLISMDFEEWSDERVN